MGETWIQNYNPLGNTALSTAVAAVPVCLLFYLLAVRKTIAYRAAVYAVLTAIVGLVKNAMTGQQAK